MEVIVKTPNGKLDLIYHHSRMMLAPTVIVANSDGDEEIKYAKAIDSIYESFVENNFSVLKFSFRKDKNVSKELDFNSVNLLDLIGALEWLHNKNIDCKSFWFAGIDIGAFYGLQLVMRRPEIDNYMLFSPTIRKDELNFLVPCTSCGVLVRASEDLRFLEEDCINLRERLITKTESKIKYFTIHGAERNFDDELGQLKNKVSEYIVERIKDDGGALYENYGAKRKKRKRKIQMKDEEKIVYINPIKDLGFGDI
jgi:alpha/beta superfamily hydrolase